MHIMKGYVIDYTAHTQIAYIFKILNRIRSPFR